VTPFNVQMVTWRFSILKFNFF